MSTLKLTELQDYRYGQLFAIAKGMGKSDLDADSDAWAGIVEEWPELAFGETKPDPFVEWTPEVKVKRP